MIFLFDLPTLNPFRLPGAYSFNIGFSAYSIYLIVSVFRKMQHIDYSFVRMAEGKNSYGKSN